MFEDSKWIANNKTISLNAVIQKQKLFTNTTNSILNLRALNNNIKVNLKQNSVQYKKNLLYSHIKINRVLEFRS